MGDGYLGGTVPLEFRSEGFSENNLGQAIMNRLLKAAGYHVEEV